MAHRVSPNRFSVFVQNHEGLFFVLGGGVVFVLGEACSFARKLVLYADIFGYLRNVPKI